MTTGSKPWRVVDTGCEFEDNISTLGRTTLCKLTGTPEQIEKAIDICAYYSMTRLNDEQVIEFCELSLPTNSVILGDKYVGPPVIVEGKLSRGLSDYVYSDAEPNYMIFRNMSSYPNPVIGKMNSWDNVRETRNKMLTDSDWTMLLDTNISEMEQAMWKNYRQGLRDIPQVFKDYNSVVWPTKPGE
jgi:hypothetical protein